jgi:hypothetical protein
MRNLVMRNEMKLGASSNITTFVASRATMLRMLPEVPEWLLVKCRKL